ncbi:MAG: hypothetical protein CVU05_04875 [Bacteroidetes bacterium HGW-Bacteroidetes-21]|jgi:hypothetical protein|nr:MAG: hypothetical protein CVU05_04875 [Bacteroidetes bacterium HGW-Bacteroidetes-21]
MKILKHLLTFLLILTVATTYSQGYKKKSSSGKKKKEKPMIITANIGMGAGEMSRSSIYGPFLDFGLKKTVIDLNKNFNFSFDSHFGFQLAFISDTYFGNTISGFPDVQLCFNFNALTGTYPPNKKKFIKISHRRIYWSWNIYSTRSKETKFRCDKPNLLSGSKIKKYYCRLRTYG